MKLSDSLKKFMQMGIGAAAMTEEKLDSLVREMVNKGELTEEEGKKTFNEFKEKIKLRRQEFQERVEKQVKKVIQKMQLVGRDEFDELKARVIALETEKAAQKAEEAQQKSSQADKED